MFTATATALSLLAVYAALTLMIMLYVRVRRADRHSRRTSVISTPLSILVDTSAHSRVRVRVRVRDHSGLKLVLAVILTCGWFAINPWMGAVIGVWFCISFARNPD
jgi:Na+-translocating ferredoxin:NAD+ oxidoreductase RnfD subunit